LDNVCFVKREREEKHKKRGPFKENQSARVVTKNPIIARNTKGERICRLDRSTGEGGRHQGEQNTGNAKKRENVPRRQIGEL